MTPLRSTLEKKIGWVLLALVLGGCVLVLLPFVSSLLWAVVLAYSCWPIYRRLVKMMGGRRTLAAVVMSLAIVCVMLLPFVLVGATLGQSVTELMTATRRWMDEGPGAPPQWLINLPAIGAKAGEYWREMATDATPVIQAAKPVVETVGGWMLTGGLVLGRGLFELSLSILIAFFLFKDGSAAAKRLATATEWIGGEKAKHLLETAGNTVRGVVYGILGTALVQAVTAGIGYFIARVPGAGILALLTFFLSVLPVGPPLIWIPASLWLFHQGSTGWGIFMLCWGMMVSSLDNVVKPWLISQGNDMPFLLIFFGVLGGALTFGFIGVFIGPTLLAVGYKLVAEWAASHPAVAGNEGEAQGHENGKEKVQTESTKP